MDPDDVERLAGERLERAEKKLSAMRSAKSAGATTRARSRKPGPGRAKLGGGASG